MLLIICVVELAGLEYLLGVGFLSQNLVTFFYGRRKRTRLKSFLALGSFSIVQ
jgi:hypothetical protein